MPTACLTSCLSLTESGRTVARLVLSKLSQCQELCVLPEGIFFFKWSSNQKIDFCDFVSKLCAVFSNKRKHLPLCSLWSWHVRERMLPVHEKGCHYTPGSLGDWHGQQPSLQPIPLPPSSSCRFSPVCEGGVWARKRQGTLAEAAGVELRQQAKHTNTHIHTHTLSQRKWNKCWLHSAVSSLTHCYPLAGMPQRKRSFTFGAYGG